MTDLNSFLKTASEKSGFQRDYFEERKIPTDYANFTIMPFFGDIRSLFVYSSILLRRYREELKGSKYFILASWPGFQPLFPFVSEYWSISDKSHLKRFYENSDTSNNRADLATIYLRSLNEHFRDVVDYRQFSVYYDKGIKNPFWEKFKHVKVFLPQILSSNYLGKEFNRDLISKSGMKIFIMPSYFVTTWRAGKSQNLSVKKEFWIELVEFLLKNGFTPVLWNHYLTYDLSATFNDKCVFLNETDISKVLSAMRATGCVLDVMNGSSRLAISARCPFLSLCERSIYSNLKEGEINDLCSLRLPKEYIFTFSTIITDGTAYAWKADLFKNIVNRLNSFMPDLNRDEWPNAVESYDIVPYDNVKKMKLKKLGTKLFKLSD